MVTFVDPNAAEQFNCVICLDIFRKPVQIECEAHVFCKECILKLISDHGQQFDCPMCRKACHSKSINRVRFIDRQINNLMVKCPNHEITVEKKEYLNNENINNSNSNNQQTLRRSKRLKEKKEQENKMDNKKQTISGHKRKRSENDVTNNNNKKRKLNDIELCDWIGTLSDLKDHIKRCPLELISCEYCDLEMLQRDSEQHYDECECFPSECHKCGESAIARINMTSHIVYHCPMTPVECIQQCGEIIRRKNQDKHIQNKCGETVVNCHFHSYGCDSRFKRKDKSAHNTTYAHNHLVRVEWTVNDLEQQNKRMNRENKAIQRKYKEIQQENHTIQGQMKTMERTNKSLSLSIDLMGKAIQNILTEQQKLRKKNKYRFSLPFVDHCPS